MATDRDLVEPQNPKKSALVRATVKLHEAQDRTIQPGKDVGIIGATIEDFFVDRIWYRQRFGSHMG